MTDERMRQLNPIIRNAIYTARYIIHHAETEPWCQRQFEYVSKMIPHSWEAPELLAGAREAQEKERAGMAARFERRRRREQRAGERDT